MQRGSHIVMRLVSVGGWSKVRTDAESRNTGYREQVSYRVRTPPLAAGRRPARRSAR